MNHTTFSVLFGIAYAAAPTSPGALCDLAAFSINVRSFYIYNIPFIVTVFPIYIVFRVFISIFNYLHCY